MEDGLAREGVLARCNQDRAATLDDVECINARRAAAVVALEEERSRAVDLARESERKLIALREQAEREVEAARRAVAEARAAAEAAYEARWRGAGRGAGGVSDSAAGPAPSFGAPVGPVMPSMTESLFDLYADDDPVTGEDDAHE